MTWYPCSFILENSSTTAGCSAVSPKWGITCPLSTICLMYIQDSVKDTGVHALMNPSPSSIHTSSFLRWTPVHHQFTLLLFFENHILNIVNQVKNHVFWIKNVFISFFLVLRSSRPNLNFFCSIHVLVGLLVYHMQLYHNLWTII